MKPPYTAQQVAADIARELRANPAAWCKVKTAKDSEGNAVLPRDPSACTWCLLGHFDKRLDGQWSPADQAFIDQLERLGRQRSVAMFNDAYNTTVEDVIALCDLVAQS